MQPEKAAAVRGWLSKAANDLRSAHIDLDANPPLIEDALFHCQQAAERSLKAFLTNHDTPLRKPMTSTSWDTPTQYSMGA